MNVHAIISTFNGSEWIVKCLDSLQNSTIDIKIDVIDNLSADDTVEIIRSRYPGVNLLVNKENMGFGRANNVMMRSALADGADYIFLLNQDAWVENNTVEELIKAHKQYPGYGIISPIHLTGSGNAMDLNFCRYCNAERCPGFLSDLYLKQTKAIYPVRFVNAAIWLISRECLEAVGLFDPIFPVYVEDVDFVSRCRFKGFEIGIVPACKAYHDRENRAVSNLPKERRIQFLNYKHDLKNPNHSLASGIGIFSAKHFKRLVSSAIRLDATEFIHEVKSGWQILSSFKAILRARKTCQAPGAYIRN